MFLLLKLLQLSFKKKKKNAHWTERPMDIFEEGRDTEKKPFNELFWPSRLVLLRIRTTNNNSYVLLLLI